MHVVYLHRRQQLETVGALEDLLSEAIAGDLIGLAYTAIRVAADHSVGAAGEARRRPILTRGLIQLLDDEVASLVGG